MSINLNLFIACQDQPGRFIQLDYYKPAGQTGIITASEGDVRHDPSGYSTFTHSLHSDRCWRHPLQGRATNRKIVQAACEVLVHLEANNVISHEDAIANVSHVKALV